MPAQSRQSIFKSSRRRTLWQSVATDVFGELKEAVDAFAEKLNAALADKEAQLSSALKEIDDEIGKPLWLREIVETKREVDGSKENEKKI